MSATKVPFRACDGGSARFTHRALDVSLLARNGGRGETAARVGPKIPPCFQRVGMGLSPEGTPPTIQGTRWKRFGPSGIFCWVPFFPPLGASCIWDLREVFVLPCVFDWGKQDGRSGFWLTRYLDFRGNLNLWALPTYICTFVFPVSGLGRERSDNLSHCHASSRNLCGCTAAVRDETWYVQIKRPHKRLRLLRFSPPRKRLSLWRGFGGPLAAVAISSRIVRG